jgi:branched-subunit amino acid ABC-type transport system permease component
MAFPTEEVRFNWRTQIYLVLGALVFFGAINLLEADASLFVSLLIWAILCACIILLLIYAVVSKNRHRARRPLLVLAILWTISVIFFEFGRSHPIAIRSAARWLVWSRDYKAQVLAEPQRPSGELKHVEWDGWGMFAQDTSVYLVYDPTDSLSAAAMTHQPGKFDNIPCKVPLVRRLETHWYSVMFYTNERWDSCQPEL